MRGMNIIMALAVILGMKPFLILACATSMVRCYTAEMQARTHEAKVIVPKSRSCKY